MNGGFCIDCGFHVDSFEGLTACPNCGSKGSPCGDEQQVNISINMQELRVLVIWAENWAHTFNGAGTVYAIAERIKKQLPAKAKDTPLSLGGEVAQLKRIYGNVFTNIKGAE